MITLARITNPEDLMTFMCHDELYKDMNIDLTDFHNGNSSIMNAWVWLVLMQDKVPMGIVGFNMIQKTTFSGHWGFYKGFRGKTRKACIKCLNYLKRQVGACTVIGITPESNRSIGLAKKLGFRVVGTLKDSTKVNGFIENQVIVQTNLG